MPAIVEGKLRPDHAQDVDGTVRCSAWQVRAHVLRTPFRYAEIMSNNPTLKDREITIRDLYPHLADEELQVAEENLERYLELELRVYERILGDPEAYARFKALTASRTEPSMEDKGRAFLNNLTLHSKE